MNPRRGKFQIDSSAVVLASGARERTLAERQWISGSRPARVFFTNHLIEWLDRHGKLPARRSVILGSDLIAYSAAAKLRAGAADESVMLDRPRRRKASLAARLFFRRWANPQWRGHVHRAAINGSREVEGVTPEGAEALACDGIVLSGELVPNTELALLGGLAVDLPERRLVLDRAQRLSSPGWFAAGNVMGGSRGAQWCHFNGRRLARRVAGYLEGE